MPMNKSLGNQGVNQRPVAGMNSRPISKMQQRSSVANINPKPIKAVEQSMQKRPVQANNQNNASKSSVSQNASNDSVVNFVNIMLSMVKGFAICDKDILNKNISLAYGNGMSMDDRTISFECADYLIGNLGFLVMGLIMDKNLKQTFLDALSVEMSLDGKSDQEKEKIRASMRDNKPYKSAGSIVLGVTSFTPAIVASLMNKMQESFDKLDAYTEEFDSKVAELSFEQKAEYGFMFSNFMYLIRAFTHNDIFMSYVITVIEKVKAIMAKGAS